MCVWLGKCGKWENFYFNVIISEHFLNTGHPNVVLFLSNGGLLGTLEAVYHGVPVVGIPFHGDQRNNIANLEARGMGIQLQYENITKQSVLDALRTVLHQPR
jgi:glucuronosyltransferase